MALTPKQQKVLQFIERFAAKNGFAPSQQEIARHFGFQSLGTVQNYLVRLERHGSLQKGWNERRGIQVLSTPPRDPLPSPPASASVAGTVPIPLYGAVAAGRPLERIESEETLDVPVSLLGRAYGAQKGARQPEHFVLRVRGDSMIGDGILDGDYVVIRKQEQADNGQTVVALLGNEATIKRFYSERGRVELRAANPVFDPIFVDSMTDSEFKIAGVLVGLIRKL
jgi:repressor LexA